MEVLNVAGSREQVSDCGFARYVDTSSPEARSKLRQLDISRCMLSQQVLVVMQALTGNIIISESKRNNCLSQGRKMYSVDKILLPHLTDKLPF